MAETIDWVLYDHGAPSHAASATVTLFDQAESAATNTYQDTNMPIAGQLPTTQKMVVHKLGVIFDWGAAVANATEESDFLDQGTLELKIADRRMFIAPLHILLAPSQFACIDIAAGASVSSNQVNWFELKNPITLNGGVPFSVEITQGLTDTTADCTIGVVLVGELTRPS